MSIDPILQNEIRHHIRESQTGKRADDFQRTVQATRAWAHDPKNRATVHAMVRPLIAQVIRADRERGIHTWTEDEIRVMCARDEGLRGFLETQTRDQGPAAVHVNQLMSNMSVRFFNSDFIGEMIAPPVPVSKESDRYAKYSERDNLAFPDNKVAGPNADLPEIGQDLDLSNSYQVEPHGMKQRVSPREIANADNPLDPLLDAQMLVMEGNAHNRELASATFFTTSGNYNSGNVTAVAAGEEWDSAGGGNPVKQIQDAAKAVWRTRGATRKVAFTGIDTYTVLARHPQLRDLKKYTTNGFVTRDEMAAYFGFDEFYVSEARKDTANKGQTASYSRMWGDYFGIVMMNPGATVRSYNFCSRFRRGTVQNETLFVAHQGSNGVYHVRETYLETIESVAPLAGALVSGCLASI